MFGCDGCLMTVACFSEIFRIFTRIHRNFMHENSITLLDDNISTARPYFISISLMSFSVT